MSRYILIYCDQMSRIAYLYTIICLYQNMCVAKIKQKKFKKRSRNIPLIAMYWVIWINSATEEVTQQQKNNKQTWNKYK